MCLQDDKYAVIEYSDASSEVKQRVDEGTGDLVFKAGNICNHVFRYVYTRLVPFVH